MAEKKRVLVVMDWYLPGYKAGGPIRSVSSMIQQLQGEIDFSIVTGDRDLGDNRPYDNIVTGVWSKAPDGVRICYLNSTEHVANHLRMILSEESFDFVYLNSLFSRNFTLAILEMLNVHFPEIRIILAPRGMLGKGALKQKHLKKMFFFLYARVKGIYRNVIWHASSPQEEVEIKSKFGNHAKVRIASNISSPEFYDYSERSKVGGELKVYFISRISPKKNLLSAIRIVNSMRTGHNVIFSIFGPIEDNVYWLECLSEIEKAPSFVSIQYCGAVDPHQMHTILKEQHLMFFPTLHENFGHVILEAMACSCPVLISDQTPWSDLAACSAGWSIPLESEIEFRAKLEYVAAMEQREYSMWSTGAYKYAMNYVSDNKNLEANRKLFVP